MKLLFKINALATNSLLNPNYWSPLGATAREHYTTLLHLPIIVGRKPLSPLGSLPYLTPWPVSIKNKIRI